MRFGVDFAAVRDHVREVIAAVAPHDSRERFNGHRRARHRRRARFTDPATVAVNGFDIKARRFIIATGSSPAVPPIPGLADMPHLTSETVFDLDDCPRHLIVIGAGRSRLELAQAFRRLGAEVTVLSSGAACRLRSANARPSCSMGSLREGVMVRSGVKIAQVRRALRASCRSIFTRRRRSTETIEGTHILVATGRGRTSPISISTPPASATMRNGIVVDRRLRTSNKQRLRHRRRHRRAEMDPSRPASRRPRDPPRVVPHPVEADSSAVPCVTFTDPELAQVGLTEDEARAQSSHSACCARPIAKTTARRRPGRPTATSRSSPIATALILGVTIVGAQAAENIAAWTLAINQKLNIEAMAGVIVPYPTYAEVGKRAAMTYFTRGLTSPLVRRIIGWLRRFG